MAARRVYDIEMGTFDDPRFRAGSTYNLGCFYATVGRTGEALALVHEAIAQAPELRQLAQHDADLVAIRHLIEADAGRSR